MRKFENPVKELKFKVLKNIAKAYFEGTDIKDILLNTPKEIVPGPKATMRCCIYKERAVVEERIALGLGGHSDNTNILEVISIACDDCPLGGYEITSHCRGCIARNCFQACKRGAIGFDTATHKSFINKDLCVNCGMCAKACNYNAIINFLRPCEAACATNAIIKGENGEAVIKDEKCVGCGHCVAKCPFGAIVDKAYIKETAQLLKNNDDHVYAIVAPSVCSSFREANFAQIASAIKKIGFYDVIETSFGADLVGQKEAIELEEKGKLTSSCCPSLVAFIKREMPEYKDYISTTLSPMATLAEYIKNKDNKAKVIFIGPCTSKKYEIKTKHVGGRVDIVLTFEELDAIFAAKDIDPSKENEYKRENSSIFGKGFATSGGVSAAIANVLKEKDSKFVFKPYICSGIKNFRSELKKFFDSNEYNFFEGMTCEEGCINGPCALYHDHLNKVYLEKYKKS